jgi:hypothetical protein
MVKKSKKIYISFIFMALFFSIFISTFGIAQEKTDSYNTMLKSFQNPYPDYSTAPFWVWNYIITKPMIDDQLKLYKDIGVSLVIIHPRPGLVTEYLSKEWFDLVKYAVDKAKKLNMKIMLYDENSYPSGFAGGHVPAAMPDVMNKNLTLLKTDKPDTVQNKICVLLKKGNEFTRIENNKYEPGNLYYVYYLVPKARSAWHAGYTYVDILQKKTTLKFLETTHEEYKKAIGKEFGKSVAAVFTDEPCTDYIYLPYTPGIFDEFKKRYGYDLIPKLPSLSEETGDYRKIRHDVYTLVLDLLVENWAKPYSQWCEKNNLPLTGHYWEHIWSYQSRVPDDMAPLAYHQIPGIDVLMNNYQNKTHCHFGQDLMVKEVTSVVNQMNRKRMLSETYGAAGWDLNFKDMKRIGDWEYALGVNIMNQHLTWGSITGYRKYDHPPSFSYHTPYFKDYKVMAEYYAHLSAALSHGKQRNKVLLLQPTTSIRMYWRSTDFKENRQYIDSMINICNVAFHILTHDFESSHVEYDIGSEYLIREFGKVEGKSFNINHGKYSLFILPPYTWNLESKTYDLLKEYLKNGGKVLSTNSLPEYIDGSESDKVKKLAEEYKDNWITAEKITDKEINNLCMPSVIFNVETGKDKLYHMRRELSDAQLLFIANVDESVTSKGNVEIKGGSVQEMDIFTGKIKPYPFKTVSDKLNIAFDLPPAGSILLCIKNEKSESIKKSTPALTKIEFTDKPEIKRIKPNNLIIDYCDLRINGENQKDLYFFDALKKIYNTYGFASDPWAGIQFKQQLRETKFPPESGFEADYKFTVDKNVNISSLRAVYERPEIFKVKINGTPVNALKGQWYIDKDFAVYDISKYVKEGENILTVYSKPMNILSELDRAIIFGDFALEGMETGFRIIPAKPLELGDWTEQGLKLYSNNVSYEHILNITDKSGNYSVKLTEWKGTCAEVYVNDKYAGLIAIDPFELDITKYLKTGKNKIKVDIVSSLRNLFGPHHTKDAIGQTWPSHFFSIRNDQGLSLSGDSYFTVPYGLIKDFEVWNRK